MPADKKSIAVILSGSGNQDGSEIHEATLTLWAIHKNGADYQCYAPDIMQHHVLNHLTGKEMDETRNVLIESARIARGNVKNLEKFDQTKHDALVIPGGLGAVKNLSSFAFEGEHCKVNAEVKRAVQQMTEADKPIGALCIAPVLLAKIIDDVLITVGQNPDVIKKVNTMGGRHETTVQGEITVDSIRKLVTTPCYMLEARVDQIGDGADKLIQKILQLIES